jgi:hypothetical protein
LRSRSRIVTSPRPSTVLAQPQLGGVLDRDHAVVGRDPHRKRIEQRGLARAGPAGDEDAAPRAHRLREQLPRSLGEGPAGDELVGVGARCREPAHRERRPVDRQRRDHDVDPRAVGQPGVGHRAELVDAPTDGREDALDRVTQRLLGVKADLARLDPAAALDEDGVVAVDHHLLHLVIRKQGLQGAKADGVAKDQVGDLRAPPRREHREIVVDELTDRGLEVDARRRLPSPALDQPQP